MRGGGAAADDDDGAGGCFVDDEVLVMVDEGLELAVRGFEVVDEVEVVLAMADELGAFEAWEREVVVDIVVGWVCVRDDGGGFESLVVGRGIRLWTLMMGEGLGN